MYSDPRDESTAELEYLDDASDRLRNDDADAEACRPTDAELDEIFGPPDAEWERLSAEQERDMLASDLADSIELLRAIASLPDENRAIVRRIVGGVSARLAEAMVRAAEQVAREAAEDELVRGFPGLAGSGLATLQAVAASDPDPFRRQAAALILGWRDAYLDPQPAA